MDARELLKFLDEEDLDINDDVTESESTSRPEIENFEGKESLIAAEIVEETLPKKLTTKYIEDLLLNRFKKQSPDYVNDLLQEYLVARTRVTKAEKDIKDHISVRDCTNCIRASWYKVMRKDIVPQSNPYLELYGMIGTLIHKYFEFMIPHLSAEKMFKIVALPYPVYGVYDMLLNQQTVVEFKTKNKLPAKPDPKHEQQVLIYAYFFRKFFNMDINLTQLVYIARGTLKVRVFNQQIYSETVNKVEKYLLEYLTDLRNFINKNEVPPETHKFIFLSDCKFCPYKHICSITQT